MAKRNLSGYTEVKDRVAAFRDAYPIADGWSIQTNLVHDDGDRVIVRAWITTPLGQVVGTGYAEEVRGSSAVNRTNPIENCETSAIGRALAACGYGGDQSYASVNEITRAKARQKEMSAPAPSNGAPDVSLKSLHAMGKTLYGDLWNEARPCLVEWITKGRGRSSKALTPAEARAATKHLAKIIDKGADPAQAWKYWQDQTANDGDEYHPSDRDEDALANA